MQKQQTQYDSGFSDGVILVLQILTSGGDCGSTDYEEILRTAGEEEVIKRARCQGMMRLSGLSQYMRGKALAV